MENWLQDALVAANKIAHGEGNEEDALVVAKALISEMSHGPYGTSRKKAREETLELLRYQDYRRSLLYT